MHDLGVSVRGVRTTIRLGREERLPNGPGLSSKVSNICQDRGDITASGLLCEIFSERLMSELSAHDVNE